MLNGHFRFILNPKMLYRPAIDIRTIRCHFCLTMAFSSAQILTNTHQFSQVLSDQLDDKPACDHGCDLAGDIDADRLHQDDVAV